MVSLSVIAKQPQKFRLSSPFRAGGRLILLRAGRLVINPDCPNGIAEGGWLNLDKTFTYVKFYLNIVKNCEIVCEEVLG